MLDIMFQYVLDDVWMMSQHVHFVLVLLFFMVVD